MIMRTLFLSLTSLLVAGFLTPAFATKFVQPEDHEVKSANGKYALKINAKTGEHKLFEGNPDKPGEAKELWSFKREVWHNDIFVANDGTHVLWVAWRHVKEESTEKGEAIIAYSAEGKVMSKTFNQISKPRARGPREVGPIGDFWRLWRTGVKQEGDTVTIAVAGKEALVVDLKNPKGGD